MLFFLDCKYDTHFEKMPVVTECIPWFKQKMKFFFWNVLFETSWDVLFYPHNHTQVFWIRFLKVAVKTPIAEKRDKSAMHWSLRISGLFFYGKAKLTGFMCKLKEHSYEARNVIVKNWVTGSTNYSSSQNN